MVLGILLAFTLLLLLFLVALPAGLLATYLGDEAAIAYFVAVPLVAWWEVRRRRQRRRREQERRRQERRRRARERRAGLERLVEGLKTCAAPAVSRLRRARR